MTAGTPTTEQETRAAARRIGVAVDRRWRLIRVLGVGGMAAVYLGTDPQERRAAVKILHPELITNHVLRQRFVREAELIESIDHPGRVDIYDSGLTNNGEPFFAMELLEGIALDRLWRQENKRLPLDYTLRIAYQVLSLLSACHDRGIIHRDLKPGNVFLTNRGRVKVLDFGIARQRTTDVDPTVAGTTFGTPSFLSPEQAMGRDVDGRADLFSLGAILHALVTGRKLHEGCSPQEAFVLAATRPVPSVATVAPELPGNVVELIDRALMWDRRHRFGNAAEMRHEVAKVLESLGTRAPESVRGSQPSTRPPQAESDAPPSGRCDEVTRGERPIVRQRAFAALEAALQARWQHGARDSRAVTALDSSYTTLRECITDLGGALTCSILPHTANHGGNVIWEPEPPCDRVLHRLFEVGFRSLTIDDSFSREQADELLTWLARDLFDPDAPEDGAVVAWYERHLPAVRLELADALLLTDVEDPETVGALLEQTRLEIDRHRAEDSARRPLDDGVSGPVARSTALRSARAAHALHLTPNVRDQLQRAVRPKEAEWEERFVAAFAAMVEEACRHHQLGLIAGPLRESLLATKSASEIARFLSFTARLGEATERCAPGLRRRLFASIFDRESLASAIEKLSPASTDNAQTVATLAVQELLERLVSHLGGDAFFLVMEYLTGLDDEISRGADDRQPPTSTPARVTVPPSSRSRHDRVRRKVTRDRGVRVVLRLQRLLAASISHNLDGHEVAEQLQRGTVALNSFCSRTREPIVLEFATDTVLINGHLLNATSSEYASALDLGRLFNDLGYARLCIQPGVEIDDLRALAAAFVFARRDRSQVDGLRECSSRITLVPGHPETLGDGNGRLSMEDRTARTYTAAVLTMRSTFSSLSRGQPRSLRDPLRIARHLAGLSLLDSHTLLELAQVRPTDRDRAKRAVNGAILALYMTRQLTSDLPTLTEVAVAALLFDVGNVHLGPLASTADAGLEETSPDESPRTAIPAGQALLAMGGIEPRNIRRVVTVLEAQWRRSEKGSPPPSGRRTPSVSALIVATAHRYGELLGLHDPNDSSDLSPDDAVSRLRSEATGPHDRAVLALLLGALGLFATGTVVELSTGETGVVLDSPTAPADYPRPRVRVIHDPTGKVLSASRDVDLRGPGGLRIVRIVTELDPALAAARRAVLIQPRAARPRPESGWATRLSGASLPERDLDGGDLDGRDHPSLDPRRSPVAPSPLSDLAPTMALDARQTAALLQDMNVHDDDAPEPLQRELELPPVLAPSRRPPPIRHPQPTASAPRSLLESESGEDVTRQSPQGRSGISLAGAKEPIASGCLRDMPLDRTLVRLLDRRETGTLALAKEDSKNEGFRHALFVQDGVVTKALVRPDVAPLAETLRSLGYLLEDDIRAPSLSGVVRHDGLLRQSLIAHGLVGSGELDHAHGTQLRRRVQRLFQLPDDTPFSFFQGLDLIGSESEPPEQVSAFALITVGLRELSNHRQLAQVLKNLGGEPLLVHEEADLAGFEFTLEEHRVVNALLLEPSVSELIANTGLDPVATRVVVHALTLTRSLVRQGAPPPLRNRMARVRGSQHQPVNGVA